MKPCLQRRNAIATLALDELDSREIEELRLHLRSCARCRDYLAEISAVTKKMSRVEMTSDVEASDAFHRRVMSRLRARESETPWEIARMIGKRLDWRLGLPVTALLVLVFAFCSELHKPNVAPKPIALMQVQIGAVANPIAVVAPTLGNYQMAADQSLKKFDELLNREAKISEAAAPVYTASQLTMADAGM